MVTTLAFFIGPMEMGMIALAGLLLFGNRLPEVGRSLGKGIIEFKKGVKGVQDEIEEASDVPEPKKVDNTTHSVD
jgi:sec-independent protein translocase protein TatA